MCINTEYLVSVREGVRGERMIVKPFTCDKKRTELIALSFFWLIKKGHFALTGWPVPMHLRMQLS